MTGVFRGVCVTSADPAGRGRLRALVPQAFGDTTTETGWALPCVAAGSNLEKGVPVSGQGVWIMFEGGDTDYPVWLGVWNP